MNMAKPTQRDLDAAGDALSVLVAIGNGDYPLREGEAGDDVPEVFDEDNPAHLRRMYDMLKATLTAAPGWEGRVIGGMCHVIMWDKNEIVDPNSSHLSLHPKIVAALAQLPKAPSAEGAEADRGSVAAITASQAAFVFWAKREGLNTRLAADAAPDGEIPRTRGNRCPATFLVDETEAAWRAWANKPEGVAMGTMVLEGTRLDALRENSWDLVCFDIPTGEGDGDVGWRVQAHYMAKPHLRTVAEVFEDDPIGALDAAIKARQVELSGRASVS